MITPGREVGLLDDFTRRWHAHSAKTAHLMALAGKPEAASLFQSSAADFEGFLDVLNQDRKFNDDSGGAAALGAQPVRDVARVNIIVSLGLLCAPCIAAGFALIRNISVPLTALTATMRHYRQRG